jgi:DNA-binding response OmpR family regulator
VTSIVLAQVSSDDRQMYAEYLRVRGYEVIEVASTDAVIPHMASTDLLITGLLIPGDLFPCDLIEGAKQGRWGKVVPVVVVTATIVVPLHHAAEAAGADRILLKPCYPDDLLNAVDAVLDRHSPPIFL